jgi:hypothetical protein
MALNPGKSYGALERLDPRITQQNLGDACRDQSETYGKKTEKQTAAHCKRRFA